jgi:hypothetical protein
VIPFINSLPLDIKSICRYNSDLSTIFDEYLFRYDPATEILNIFRIDILDTNPAGVYFYKSGKCAGNWDGSRGWSRQHLMCSESGKATVYVSEAHYGGEHIHSWWDTVTYFGNPSLSTYDSMRCVYFTGSSAPSNKIEAHYFLKYTKDDRLDTIHGKAEKLFISNGSWEHSNFYKELLVYSYNSMKQLEKVDYSSVNTDSNIVYKRKLYWRFDFW